VIFLPPLMMSRTLEELIKASYHKVISERKHYRFNNLEVFVKDPLPENINLAQVVEEIEKKLPSFCLYGLDAIYVGDFADLRDREIVAKLADGAIYLSNAQKSNVDIATALIHEIAHNVENIFGADIYASGAIEDEFLGKRKKLARLLKYQNKNAASYDFENLQYDKSLDDFLYKEIGYPKLTSTVMGLFISPYATTSIREYFAKGFEDYYLNNGQLIRHISPALYKKIDDLNDLEDNI